MTHIAGTRVFACLVLAAGAALLGGCLNGEKTPPEPGPDRLGQSVPDRFNAPKEQPPGTAISVKQGDPLKFTFAVVGKPGDKNVDTLTLLLTTNKATSPFGINNSFTMTNVARNSYYEIEVKVDPNATPGTYEVKACLSPYIFPVPKTSLPAVQQFIIKVDKKIDDMTNSATPGK